MFLKIPKNKKDDIIRYCIDYGLISKSIRNFISNIFIENSCFLKKKKI